MSLAEEGRCMMMRKLKEKPLPEEAIEDNSGCQHYWVIEAANGPSSMGTCRYCGESREFFNSIPDLNALKRGTAPKPNPFGLPEMKNVALEKESNS
jgi:hypothetical protein